MSVSKSEILSIVEKQMREGKLNNFAPIGMADEPMWDDCIIGFSRGDDSYYDFLKKDIGDFHWSPAEAFNLGKKGANVESKDLCVLAIAFSQTQKTKEANAKETKDPADRWVVSRGKWEVMMEDISEKIVMELEQKGIRAVAIDHIKEFSRKASEKYGVASKWSHRHVAFISGLGTFGQCDGLITKKGKAVRFTTILMESDLSADVREYEKYNEWCKFVQDKSCNDCMKRCPINAITEKGHDKEKCMKFIDKIKETKTKKGLMLPEEIGSPCGLCQTGVACQDGRPV